MRINLFKQLFLLGRSCDAARADSRCWRRGGATFCGAGLLLERKQLPAALRRGNRGHAEKTNSQLLLMENVIVLVWRAAARCRLWRLPLTLQLSSVAATARPLQSLVADYG